MVKKVSRFLATGFYVGYLPTAPGTWGSLLMIFLLYLFPLLNNFYVVFALSLGGIAIANFEEKQNGIKDESKIVIDEMAGQLLTFFTIQKPSLTILLLGFILFRVFDITKPLIIDKIQSLPAGWGVMLDDLLAGLFSLVILKIVIYLI
ncbi:phosphatidylglycerophosphatase A family protein [Halanaerobium salsuginis]|uniref:Phosphatidylglycerophosphatase A n=1 Tax=Halanaerobium salsuginis TaxID=29563 RepID=A0A1I4F6T9_9FIRM|nr:phosphatidylglycerophosphatase A [Halanaerobium salsuginis]SFL13010.1 phosphatidylglycerophosphatase A [Halanaerobium salsuginis]